MSMTKPTSEQVTFLAAGAGASQRTALDKLRDTVSVKDFGAVGDNVTDDTDSFEAAATYSNATSSVIFVPVGNYRIRGLDLKGKNGATFVGENNRLTSGTTLRSIGVPNITSGGKSVFIRVNDGVPPSGPFTTGCCLQNMFVLEEPGSTRNIGLLATAASWFNLNNVRLWGFDDGAVVSYLWNAYFEYLAIVNPRIRGFVSELSNTNGIELRSIHVTSSTTTPECNFDLTGSNSIHIFNPITEGNCNSHFRVGASTQEVSIYGIHLENGKNVIEYVQPNVGGPTQLTANVLFYGGGMYPVGTADAADKFMKYVGPSSLVGLRSLTLDGIVIQKSNTCHSSYLNLSKVANFKSTATFTFNANAAIDDLTWHNIGADINQAYATSASGHNGLVSSNQRAKFCTYSGTTNTSSYTRYGSNANLAAGRVVANIPLNSRRKILDIDVLFNYNAGAFASLPDFARFVGGIAFDGTTSVPAATVSQGAYAVNTTFSYNAATGDLTATNATGFGDFMIFVRVTENA